MKKRSLVLGLLIFFFTSSADARISDDLRIHLPQYLVDVHFTQNTSDNVIFVRATEVKNAQMAKPIYLEVEISNIDHTREIFIVNHSNSDQIENRQSYAQFISESSSPEWMNSQASKGKPLVMYVGEGNDNKSRFLILAPGISSSTYVDIYVKMGGKQFENHILVKGNFN